MKIERVALLDALSRVQPGLARKEVIEQSASFIFRNGMVSTFNEEIAVTTKLPLKIKGAVKAEEFYKLLRKSRAKTLDISVEGNELLLTTKSSSAGIRLQHKISLPLEEVSKPTNKWHKLPERFAEAIRMCLFCASTDVTKPILRCVHAKGSMLEACDNFRLMRFDMGKGGKKTFKKDVLIPAEAAAELLKYQPTRYCKSEAWLHFETAADTVFSCRVLAEKYPDLSAFVDFKGKSLEMPSKVKGMLERAAIFTSGNVEIENLVEVEIDGKLLTVSGEGPGGWFKEHRKLKFSGKPIRFRVNPELLKRTVSILSKMTVGKGKLKLHGEHFTHVLHLVVTDKKKRGKK